ncbi:MAG: hypothetical protein JSU70_03990 [Phycisphaerales bacterium]|nr:MAG: hypothetical protein JSU70_03990 [Phycisphaerales bacterium]
MDTAKLLAILFAPFVLVVVQAGVAVAGPMGSSFSYQGRLLDGDGISDGLHDFQFKLFDGPDPDMSTQVGLTIHRHDVDVVEGYVSAALYFGDEPNIFNGQARWLEIAVRPGDSSDSDDFVILRPRQELMPTPYALCAAGVAIPLSLGGAETGAIVSGTNSGSGTGVRGETTAEGGIGLEGRSSKAFSQAVSGGAAGYFSMGVSGTAEGERSQGVRGEATGTHCFGGSFRATGETSYGVSATAISTEEGENYGGYFIARGRDGQGVHGEGESTGDVTNYGGYFVAYGDQGRGVHGRAAGSSGRGVYGLASAKSGRNFGVYGQTFSPEGYAGYFVGRSLFSGSVGIDTADPQGMLDVNGSIYQRGSQLHADYVFEPGYELESIEEHSEFMWTNKHLKAIPKAATDESGRQKIEVGAHRKGIVEELEKAHIYIEQLHERIKTLEEDNGEIARLRGRVSDLTARLQKMEATLAAFAVTELRNGNKQAATVR